MAKAVTISIAQNPPSPTNGSGEVMTKFGETEQNVVLRFDKGRIVDVVPNPVGNGLQIMLMQTQGPDKTLGVETGITTCYKCAYDSVTGHVVCWDVPC